MIRQEYVTSFQHNYMKIKVKKEKCRKTRYQYQILTSRKLGGLLPATMQVHNGEEALFYEISSRQCLSKWFIKEKITQAWMEQFMGSLKSAMWSLEQFLLDERNLILHPDYIFQDVRTDHILFLYYPYYIEQDKPELEAFLSFLVENIGEEERELADIVYEIYEKRELMGDDFTVESLLQIWEQKMQAAKKEVLPLPVKEVEEPREIEEESGKKESLIDMLFGRNRSVALAREEWRYQADTSPLKEEVEPATETELEEHKLYGIGKENRNVIGLGKLPLVIGRKDGLADVILGDDSISQMHARFAEENGEIWLEDLNSEQGTYKNGAQLCPYERVEILREDEIRLGKLKFTYR